jgi:hypothetical protein
MIRRVAAVRIARGDPPLWRFGIATGLFFAGALLEGFWPGRRARLVPRAASGGR